MGEVEHKINNQQRNDGGCFYSGLQRISFRNIVSYIIRCYWHIEIFSHFLQEMEYLNKSQRTMTKDIVYEETVERKGYYQ